MSANDELIIRHEKINPDYPADKNYIRNYNRSNIMPNQYTIISLQERFWSKVNITNLLDCWEWTASKDSCGYGTFIYNKKFISSNRMAYILVYGNIPINMHVLHKCDNPTCCNPAHLFLGTHQDNMIDRNRKGRCAKIQSELTHLSKLKKSQVMEIRNSNDTVTNLARRFGVTYSTIWKVKRKDTWKNI